jgi:hypothetical protein
MTDLVEYFICVPYPGTRVYERPQDFGVSIVQKPWSQWREDAVSVMRTPDLSEEDIHSLWREGLGILAEAMASAAENDVRT